MPLNRARKAADNLFNAARPKEAGHFYGIRAGSKAGLAHPNFGTIMIEGRKPRAGRQLCAARKTTSFAKGVTTSCFKF
jgi:hypothetical protein